jgi:hypothetical protein
VDLIPKFLMANGNWIKLAGMVLKWSPVKIILLSIQDGSYY